MVGFRAQGLGVMGIEVSTRTGIRVQVAPNVS